MKKLNMYKPEYIYKISLNHLNKTYAHCLPDLNYENKMICEIGHNRITPLMSFSLGKFIKQLTGYKFAQD